MNVISVQTKRPYEVRIERGLLARTGEQVAGLTTSRRAAILTDDTVDRLYGGTVERSLNDAGFETVRMSFPHGEGSKNLSTYGAMLDFLAENHLTRADTVIALGGGVTGDLAGFAAATYLRGVAVVQIPTTFLAMIDSSVGGKTGVDLPSGKNLVGAFHQPLCVLCDPDALQTLPDETFADGTAEALKYGVLGSETLFTTLSTGSFADELEAIVGECVAAKAALAAQDETDRGCRQLLNLGHTLGHGIEKCSGYSISHGQAVGIGMVYAKRIAVKLGRCDKACLPRLLAALEHNALPTQASFSADALYQAALGDKKRMGDTLTFVLPRRIGECELYPTPIGDLRGLIELAVNA